MRAVPVCVQWGGGHGRWDPSHWPGSSRFPHKGQRTGRCPPNSEGASLTLSATTKCRICSCSFNLQNRPRGGTGAPIPTSGDPRDTPAHSRTHSFFPSSHRVLGPPGESQGRVGGQPWEWPLPSRNRLRVLLLPQLGASDGVPEGIGVTRCWGAGGWVS